MVKKNPSIILIFFALTLLLVPISCQQGTASKLSPEDFTADFDQGNIRNVTKVAENEFNMEIDPKEEYGEDRPQWYYFQIKQNAKGQKVTFHIQGARGFPPVYSYDQVHWKRIPDFRFSEDVLIADQKIVVIARDDFSLRRFQPKRDAEGLPHPPGHVPLDSCHGSGTVGGSGRDRVRSPLNDLVP